MNANTTIKIPVIVTKRREYWVAYTPALKTYGYSNVSEEDAFKDLDEAIDAFFHVQITLGILNRSLLKLGWVRRESESVFEIPHVNSEISPFRQKSAFPQERQINIPAYC